MNGAEGKTGRTGFITVISIVILVLFILSLAVYLLWSDMNVEMERAPDFEIGPDAGNVEHLYNLTGSPVILHFTNIENPMCLECEKVLEGQVREIEKACTDKDNLTVITVNMRKNPYSEPGYELVHEWWDINITWIWLEDPEPFPISGKYADYWSMRGGSSNPTILLLDEDLMIVGIYHVYMIGEGEIDGLVTSEQIIEKTDKIEQGKWEGVEGERAVMGSGSFFGMFILGVITSFSPCSIALLFTVFTFMISRRRQYEDSDLVQTPSVRGVADGFSAGLSFVIAISRVFFTMGLLIARMGEFVQGARYFDIAAGVILVVLGLNNIFSITELLQYLKDSLLPIHPRRRTSRAEAPKSLKERIIKAMGFVFGRSPVAGAFLLGVFFSLGWAPCAVSLVLPVVVWILSQDISVIVGGLLFFFFGLGHGIIIIPLSVGTSSFSVRLAQRFVNAAKWVRVIFGIMVIAMGVIFSLRFFGVKLW